MKIHSHSGSRACLLAGLLLAVAVRQGCAAGEAQPPEPTRQQCLAALQAVRVLAAALPADDLTRRFAEIDLQQALTEADNGEYDDCLEWVERAEVEVREHHHSLEPGETLDVRPAQ